MCKIIIYNERTWLNLNAHSQEAYLDREELEQNAGLAGYGSTKNMKHGEMEDDFMIFALEMVAHDAAFKKVTTTNKNMSTKLRQQEDYIQSLQAEIYNLKVVAATQTTDVRGKNKGKNPYASEKNRNFNG